MKLSDLTPKESRAIKKDASGRSCWCKDGRTCEPCLNRAAKKLLKAISEREREGR